MIRIDNYPWIAVLGTWIPNLPATTRHTQGWAGGATNCSDVAQQFTQTVRYWIRDLDSYETAECRSPLFHPEGDPSIIRWHRDAEDTPGGYDATYTILWVNTHPTEFRDRESHQRITGIEPYRVILAHNRKVEHRTPFYDSAKVQRWFCRIRTEERDQSVERMFQHKALGKENQGWISSKPSPRVKKKS